MIKPIYSINLPLGNYVLLHPWDQIQLSLLRLFAAFVQILRLTAPGWELEWERLAAPPSTQVISCWSKSSFSGLFKSSHRRHIERHTLSILCTLLAKRSFTHYKRQFRKDHISRLNLDWRCQHRYSFQGCLSWISLNWANSHRPVQECRIVRLPIQIWPIQIFHFQAKINAQFYKAKQERSQSHWTWDCPGSNTWSDLSSDCVTHAI